MVGDPLGIGARGATQGLFHLAGDGAAFPTSRAYLAIKASTNGSGMPCWTMPCLATSGGISW